MDPWKPIRLWLCIAVCVGFLAVGGYARLMWGVPEAPYGVRPSGIWEHDDDWSKELMAPRRLDPFSELQVDMGIVVFDLQFGENGDEHLVRVPENPRSRY